ncbi:hypothetical protein [Pontibacter sp. G13]|uniref:hypothetical protein n=1 Tax=Pontibacter sp. G13 TaxID=3074898 RepID=UPI00288BA300|nr:hypothetical protein [Pontibacter sp. G13]WNJ18927.1 hypothetical protein RJD25_00430 [Pontibacter sp. G13]
MKNLGLVSVVCCLLMVMLFQGCGDIGPVWKEDKQPEQFTLSFSEPVEFTISLPPGQPDVQAYLEFSLTYYTGIARNTLPLFMVLEDNDLHQIKEFTTQIPLKENGQWKGLMHENEIDYYLTHVAIPSLTIEAGKTYSLKVYADDEKDEKIYGIVSMTGRLFENTPQPDA